ncbi:MAG: hypothetical protein ABIT82_13195 [Ramlibacter sp.]
MKKSRRAAALAVALPFVSPLWARTAPEAPTKALGIVTITGGQPTSLPTQIPTHWVEVPAAGQKLSDLRSPAALLEILPAGGAAGGHQH